MKKNIKRIVFAILMSFMVGGVLQVKAAPATITDASTPHELTITRTVQSSNAVTNTFNYTITAASTNPAGATGVPASASVVFTGVTPSAGVATATGTISFSGSSFTEVGDYEYTITETTSSNSTAFPLSTNSYKAYVSVRFDTSGNMVATLAPQATNLADSTKGTITFTSTPAVYSSLKVINTVTGNMADRNKVFTYAVEIGGTTGDTYDIVYSNGSTGIYTVGNTNQTVTLKHGESVTIGEGQIPLGTKFTITEQDATDYDTDIYTCVSTTECNTTATTSKTTGELTLSISKSGEALPSVSFENSKSEATITGIVLSIFPYILIVSVIVAATIFYMTAQKKQNNANI